MQDTPFARHRAHLRTSTTMLDCCTATRLQVYTSTFKILQSALDVRPCIGLHDLVTQFGCTSIRCWLRSTLRQ